MGNEPKSDRLIPTEIKKGIYRHFKGNEYEVIGTAFHSETLEEMVVYRALYGDRNLWVRPLSMFMDKDRFVYVREKE